MLVVEGLELAECVKQQVPLVPDQRAVEQFAAAGRHTVDSAAELSKLN
jgi:hypothetical protein